MNALVYGSLCRFDEAGRSKAAGSLPERPGPWSFLPISASVTAGARLLLAVVHRMVSDLGGAVAYRDTDSSLVASGPVEGQSVR